mgnify:CR=1 FL=1
MRSINYSRYTGEDVEGDSESLMQAISSFLLGSGFERDINEHTLEDLKEAIRRALEEDHPSLREMGQKELDSLLDRMVEKLASEGYLNLQESSPRQIKVEITDKSLDFLGYKTLKDLLASVGRSSFGSHDTRELATGVETSGSSKQYEFGDTMNLDIGETLFSAIRREGAHVPLNMEA